MELLDNQLPAQITRMPVFLIILTLISVLVAGASLWGLHVSMSRLDWRNHPLASELGQFSGRQQALYRQLSIPGSPMTPELNQAFLSYYQAFTELGQIAKREYPSLQKKQLQALSERLEALKQNIGTDRFDKMKLQRFLLDASREFSRIKIALEQRQIIQTESRLDEVARWEALLLANLGWILLFGSIFVFQLRRQERANLEQALKDGLTGLANRTCFRNRLNEQLEQTKRYRGKLAIHLLDLDGFKDINDTLGHHQGDRLLQAVADRFLREVRGSDLVARIGGDEFAVIQPMLDDEVSAEALARRLCQSLDKPIQLGSETCHVSTSCGISIYPDNGATVEQLMTQADLAMYQAKSSGSSLRFHFFEDQLNKMLERKRDLADDLFHAVEDDLLSLVYQPQINLQTGQVQAIECLLRWVHPRYGKVGPQELLELAERYVLLEQLEEWIIERALQTARKWPQERKLCINLFELSSSRLERLNRHMEMAGMAREQVMLELKEDQARKAETQEPGILRECRNMGYELVLDDFGPGGSSLNFLVGQPWSRVKLDCRFLQELEDFSHGKQLLTSLKEMVEALGIDLIIEGLESEQEFQLISQVNCHIAQGHYIHSPCEYQQLAEELPKLVEKFSQKIAMAK